MASPFLTTPPMTASNASSPATLSLARPDDWHLHLRDVDMLAAVLPPPPPQFRRPIVMPNLKPPTQTTAPVQPTRGRVLEAMPDAVPPR
ncbi:dihydroorotase, partial [Burkholderia contaminans]